MTLSLELPTHLSRRLHDLAQRTGRSEAACVIDAIREQIGDMEDLVDAEQRLIANRAGESQSIPLGEMMKRYGMEG